MEDGATYIVIHFISLSHQHIIDHDKNNKPVARIAHSKYAHTVVVGASRAKRPLG
jgi:hypothetical protein